MDRINAVLRFFRSVLESIFTSGDFYSRDAYLAAATDIVDLERRLKNVEYARAAQQLRMRG